jgi:hypothetical protein
MLAKVDLKKLITLGLVIVLLYSGVRTLMTLTAGQKHIAKINDSIGNIRLEPVLGDLEQSFFAEADTVDSYDVSRNPLEIRKNSGKSRQRTSPPRPATRPQTRQLPRLTGLVLDKNPVAIMEIDGMSVEVKTGDLIDGKKVVHIDEQGVHLLVNGKLETIR